MSVRLGSAGHAVRHAMPLVRDGRVLVPGMPARRRLARAVLSIGKTAGVLVLRAADTHVHVIVTCGRIEAGQVARTAEPAAPGGEGLAGLPG